MDACFATATKDLFKNYGGVGREFDLSSSYLLVSQHSVTTEYNDSRNQIEETLSALEEINLPTIMLWPNADAGGDDISKGIRSYRERNKPLWLYLFKNLPTHIYIHLMNNASCLVGNSSSGLREGSYIGTPVVNVGTRQNRRLRTDNVVQVDYKSNDIANAIRSQIKHGKYQSSDIYGDGTAGEKIADILANCEPCIQKTITY
mgnify:FL=1